MDELLAIQADVAELIDEVFALVELIEVIKEYELSNDVGLKTYINVEAILAKDIQTKLLNNVFRKLDHYTTFCE